MRDPGSRRGPTDLNALIDKTLELLRHQPRFAASELVTALDPALPAVIANEGQLRQVFLGIAANALEAMDGRGRLTVRTRARGDEAEIEFEDVGPGIPADILPRLFDPFFTTKPPGRAPASGSPSPRKSSPITRDASRCSRVPARAPRSASSCP